MLVISFITSYHRMHEAVAMGSILIHFEKWVSSLADLITKLSESKEQGVFWTEYLYVIGET